MKRKLIILGLILTLVALPLAACAKPAPAPAPAPAPVTEEWTYIVASPGPEVESVKAYSDELRKRTNNQSPILIPKTRGELGMKGEEHLDAISGGVLKVGHVLGNYVGGEEPLLATGGLPFLYAKKDSRAAIEAARPFCEDVLNKHGLKLLYICEFPNIVWSKIPWESVDVIPKLKLRTSSKPAVKAMEALGAKTIILQSAEIYTSMTTGLINSFSYGPMSGLAKSFYETSNSAIVGRSGGNLSNYWKLILSVSQKMKFVTVVEFLFTRCVEFSSPRSIGVRHRLLSSVRPCFQVSAINSHAFAKIRQGIIKTSRETTHDVFNHNNISGFGQFTHKTRIGKLGWNTNVAIYPTSLCYVWIVL